MDLNWNAFFRTWRTFFHHFFAHVFNANFVNLFSSFNVVRMYNTEIYYSYVAMYNNWCIFSKITNVSYGKGA